MAVTLGLLANLVMSVKGRIDLVEILTARRSSQRSVLRPLCYCRMRSRYRPVQCHSNLQTVMPCLRLLMRRS